MAANWSCCRVLSRLCLRGSGHKIHSYMGNTTSSSKLHPPPPIAQIPPPPKMHFKCRNCEYPRGDIQRFPVPDNKVSWRTEYPEYKPVEFTSKSVASQPVWADKDIKKDPKVNIQFNTIDGKINRRSHNGPYEVVEQLPRNPVGRTGIVARGTLGRWGPNHAADPIVTRWQRDDQGAIVKDKSSGKPVLEFISIQRKDSGEWAIPGGMVDAGETVSVTLKREFSEEAMNALEASKTQKKELEKRIHDLFKRGKTIYMGYVDDPRNTDNSWMETVAVNFHDEDGTSVARFKLTAGDDAVGVKWTAISEDLKLFASHEDFIKLTAELHAAHW